jgi:hypothetical protein
MISVLLEVIGCDYFRSKLKECALAAADRAQERSWTFQTLKAVARPKRKPSPRQRVTRNAQTRLGGFLFPNFTLCPFAHAFSLPKIGSRAPQFYSNQTSAHESYHRH